MFATPDRGYLAHSPAGQCNFPNSPAQTTASRSVAEEYIYQMRDQVSTRRIPFFLGGGHEGARADLESALRPCPQRVPSGDKDSVRNKPIPWALAATPQHFLWQPASDLNRDLFVSSRIAEINCKPEGPACQVRSFT